MKNSELAREIAAGHNPQTDQQASEIKAAIKALTNAERHRKQSWRVLEELLDRYPEAAGQCREELAAAKAELGG